MYLQPLNKTRKLITNHQKMLLHSNIIMFHKPSVSVHHSFNAMNRTRCSACYAEMELRRKNNIYSTPSTCYEIPILRGLFCHAPLTDTPYNYFDT